MDSFSSGYTFSSEQVSKYHPDKFADQISDAVVTECLKQDTSSRVACECLVKNDTVILAGEITSRATLNYGEIARRVGRKLGYAVERVETYITRQSPQIAQGVDLGGAGDQGMMFGYACRESWNYLPFGFGLANEVIDMIESDVQDNPNTILLGEAKTQVTVDVRNPRKPLCVLVSACHKEGVTKEELTSYLIRLLQLDCLYMINPAGAWTHGGAFADCGLTGRKIVCDQYGGYARVGGGALSGKDPTKVDRSATYMARKIAVDAVKEFEVENCSVQLGYAIGVANPVSVHIESTPQGVIPLDFIKRYDLTPSGMIKELGLLSRNYERIAEGCHFRYDWW